MILYFFQSNLNILYIISFIFILIITKLILHLFKYLGLNKLINFLLLLSLIIEKKEIYINK